MAGFKHRYLILKINAGTRQFTPHSLKSVLEEKLYEHFGAYSLSLIDCLEVIEYYEALCTAIVRCNLEIYKYLCYAIATIGRIGKTDAKIEVVDASGILRRAKKRFLKLIDSSGHPRAP